MKLQRKLLSAVLSCVMLFALYVPALAAEAYADVTGSEWYTHPYAPCHPLLSPRKKYSIVHLTAPWPAEPPQPARRPAPAMSG